jgi:hypothetical protein
MCSKSESSYCSSLPIQNQANLPFKKAGEKVISILPQDAFKVKQDEAAKLLEQQLAGFNLEINNIQKTTSNVTLGIKI